MKINWKKLLDEFKYKYSPAITSVNPGNKDSRRNWILFMAQKTGRFPVRQVYNKLIPSVSKMTVNTDFLFLEKQGLIRREKDSDQLSYVIPIFKDSGEKPKSSFEKKKQLILDIGLPAITILLFAVFLWINA